MSNMILTGGSGKLGTELKELIPSIWAPRGWLQLKETQKLYTKGINKYEPVDVIIHAAAYTKVAESHDQVLPCYLGNVEATQCLLNVISEAGCRVGGLIYISTDYVFDSLLNLAPGGDPSKGLKKEIWYKGHRRYEPLAKYRKSGWRPEDTYFNPSSPYAWTKLIGEEIVATFARETGVPCSIVRTSFKPKEPYAQGYTDQYSSADFVDVIAKEILFYALNFKKFQALDGMNPSIFHIGTSRKSMWELMMQRNPKCERIQRPEGPMDTTMWCGKYWRMKEQIEHKLNK